MENTYYVNYHTGAGDFEQEAATLEEVKRLADEGAAYTQQPITIEADGIEIARRRWIGCEYDESRDDCENPICFGSFGFYADWSDD